jgi:hypothetical protein
MPSGVARSSRRQSRMSDSSKPGPRDPPMRASSTTGSVPRTSNGSTQLAAQPTWQKPWNCHVHGSTLSSSFWPHAQTVSSYSGSR